MVFDHEIDQLSRLKIGDNFVVAQPDELSGFGFSWFFNEICGNDFGAPGRGAWSSLEESALFLGDGIEFIQTENLLVGSNSFVIFTQLGIGFGKTVECGNRVGIFLENRLI